MRFQDSNKVINEASMVFEINIATVISNPCLKWFHTWFRCDGKTGIECILVIFKESPWIIISMESSRRDLYIAIVVDRLTVSNSQITLFLCITFIPKTGIGLLHRVKVSLSGIKNRIRWSAPRAYCQLFLFWQKDPFLPWSVTTLS